MKKKKLKISDIRWVPGSDETLEESLKEIREYASLGSFLTRKVAKKFDRDTNYISKCTPKKIKVTIIVEEVETKRKVKK